MTLVMTLRKKIEPKDGDDEKEEGKDEPKPEYVTINRILEVGAKVKRPRFDSYKDEYTSDEYYPIRIGPRDGFDDPGEESRTNVVFLVNSYKVSPLQKNLEDLKAEEPPEPPPGEGEPEKEAEDAPGKEAEESTGKPKDEPETEPKKDEPAEPKKDEPEEPKQDEPEEPEEENRG
jgi:hypothetical protein